MLTRHKAIKLDDEADETKMASRLELMGKLVCSYLPEGYNINTVYRTSAKHQETQRCSS